MAQVPYLNISSQTDPQFAFAVTQNFQQLKLAGTDLLPNTLPATQLGVVLKDSDSRMSYSANWTSQSASGTAPFGYVGGYGQAYHYTKTTNEYVFLSYTTPGFNLYCIKGPSCGQINVSIDGGSPTLVDLYASAYTIANVYSTVFTGGLKQHTIKATLLNTKNSSSTGFDFGFIGIGNTYELSDTNFAPGGITNISVNSINANSAAFSGSLSVYGQLIVPNGIQGIQFQNSAPGAELYQARIFSNGTNSLTLVSGASGGGINLYVSPFGTIAAANSIGGFYYNSSNAPEFDFGNNTIFTETSSASVFKNTNGGGGGISFQMQNRGNQVMFQLNNTGKVYLPLSTTTTTSPSAGGAGALPATPAGYITININGVDRQIAYY